MAFKTRFVTALLLLLPATLAAQGAQPRTSPARGLTELSQSLQDLAERVSPSVVQIFVTGYAEPDEDDQAASEPVLERTSGSGVIVDADGYIVTNAHVVRARHADRGRAGAVPRPAARPGRRSCGAAVASSARRSWRSIRRPTSRSSRSKPKDCRCWRSAIQSTLRPGRSCWRSAVRSGSSPRSRSAWSAPSRASSTPEDPMIYVQTDAPINPGQQRRRARRYRRTAGRHQHAHLFAVGRQRRASASRRRATSFATSSRRFARPAACAAEISAFARRRSRRFWPKRSACQATPASCCRMSRLAVPLRAPGCSRATSCSRSTASAWRTAANSGSISTRAASTTPSCSTCSAASGS